MTSRACRRGWVVGLLWMIAGLGVSGCGQTYVIKSRFEAADVEWAKGSGTAELRGQAFLMTVGGTPRTCAGELVTMMPNIARSREETSAWMNPYIARVQREASSPPIPMRTTQCDASGNFRFRNLPAGDWLLITRVEWLVPYGRLSDKQGGFVRGFASTKPGEAEEVLLTDRSY